jgi:hypothetical protein
MRPRGQQALLLPFFAYTVFPIASLFQLHRFCGYNLF